MLFWGTTFVSGRVLSQTHHPFSVAFIRFLIATAVLIPLALSKNQIKTPSLKKILGFCLLGLSGVFAYNYFFFSGLKLVEAGRSSVIIAVNPTITALLAAMFFNERLSITKALGVLMAFAGALIVISKGSPSQLLTGGFGQGEFYISCAVASWVSYTLLGKQALKSISPLEATTWACSLGALMLLPFAWQNGLATSIVTENWLDWFNFANLGVLATVLGFIWYYEGIRELGAAKASAFINLAPVFAISSGMIFLGESISMSLLGGGVLIATGISLVNRK